ncbi:Oligopeptide transport system permease protein OppC [compost metagenome]
MSEAGLSFLGMGVQPPTASWGNMLSDAQSLTVLTDQPWLWVPAGTMLLITVLAINFVGDGLRDALDPKR